MRKERRFLETNTFPRKRRPPGFRFPPNEGRQSGSTEIQTAIPRLPTRHVRPFSSRLIAKSESRNKSVLTLWQQQYFAGASFRCQLVPFACCFQRLLCDDRYR